MDEYTKREVELAEENIKRLFAVQGHARLEDTLHSPEVFFVAFQSVLRSRLQ